MRTERIFVRATQHWQYTTTKGRLISRFHIHLRGLVDGLQRCTFVAIRIRERGFMQSFSELVHDEGIIDVTHAFRGATYTIMMPNIYVANDLLQQLDRQVAQIK